MFESNAPFLSPPVWRPGNGPLLAPNTAIGRFVIQRALGTGSVWVVYLAHDRARDEEVAVKIATAAPAGMDAARLLQRELAFSSRVADHTHVIQVYDIHHIPWGMAELVLLSMERADQGTLRQWIEANGRDVDLRRIHGTRLFRQICQGVQACHDVGIAHGDITPENVLLAGGRAKISDLGRAALCPAEPGEGGDSHALADGRHDGPTPQSDLVCLGLVLCELLQPETAAVLAGRDAEAIASHLRLLGDARIPEARVIMRCLARDPAERYSSVADLLGDLDGQAGTPARARSRRSGEVYAAIDEGLEIRSLAESCELLQEAVRSQAGHEASYMARVRLGVRARQYRRAAEEGFAAARQHDLPAATSFLRRARELNHGEGAAESALESIESHQRRMDDARRRIENAIDAGEWDRAAELAQGILDGPGACPHDRRRGRR